MKNPKWQRDELILALDLYFRHNPSQLSQTHEEVVKLSKILNTLAADGDKVNITTFRNPNGVYMKLCNYLRFDPNYSGAGLSRGAKLEEEVWDEFSNNLPYLRKIAQTIIDNAADVSIADDGNVFDDEEFPEGKVLYKLHRARERNSKLIKRAKEAAMKNGTLACAVCGFDFYEAYGELGKGYIECHHTIPLSQYQDTKVTRIKDIALVCSNCHRMIHRKRPWLSISELNTLVN